MVGRRAACALLMGLSFAAPAHAFDWDAASPFVIGGRAEYMLQVERAASPFTSNVSGNSAVDRTRLMLDLKTKKATYGALYLKGAALWDDTDPARSRKPFRFEQGDYLWAQDLERWSYGLRFFARERRFFTQDMIAPVLDDDKLGESDNLGARFESDISDRGRATALFSLVGDDGGDTRRLAFVKAGYSWHHVGASASYLYDDPGRNGLRRRALVRGELTGGYRWVSVIAAYEQSDLRDDRFFFPGGSFDWGAYDGGNLSAVLPPGGALHGEARLVPVAFADGHLKFVWRYDAVREAFAGDLSRTTPAEVGHSPALFYRADDVNLNARLLYRRSVRFALESEERELMEGAVWATLENGTDVIVRGRLGRLDESSVLDADENHLLMGARYVKRKVESGVYVMFKDIDTPFSGRRFAWDGKISVSANWRFYWRLLIDDTLGLGEQAFLRLEYRPNDRLYFVASSGRGDVGDGPFVLEDRDVGLVRGDDALYRLTLRGDF